MKKSSLFFILLLVFAIGSCVKFPSNEEIRRRNLPAQIVEDTYLYPFDRELSSAVANVVVYLKEPIDINSLNIDIPHLKYNKSWLFMLTQDDCKQAAFSETWAAINGAPISREYYYDYIHLINSDLPPDSYTLGKTLGSTDGAGNEVRFTYTTTLSPQWEFMFAKPDVNQGFKGNFFRFFMKSGLIWDNVREILNYGNGIAFHDVMTSHEDIIDSIRINYEKSQKIIIDNLSGRGCKVLAEPNGNKTYVQAAMDYYAIQAMTAQSGTIVLYPFTTDLSSQKHLINRVIYENDLLVRDDIINNLMLPVEERSAIHVGIHGTGELWVQNMLWINDQYGKDGDDSVWFTSFEEYFEYNFYRANAIVSKKIEGNRLTISVNLPSGYYFYFPSITFNVKGLNVGNVLSVDADDVVTGLSYGDFNGDLMVNIDCRKFLKEHATVFVERYERDKSTRLKRDAQYFVSKLKETDEKRALMERIK